MILIASMYARIPPSPDNFKRVIKYHYPSHYFIVASNQWQTLYSHLRLILGRNPFKVIRMQQQLNSINAFPVSRIKEIPLLAILTRNNPQTFALSSCQYVRTVPEKNACYRPLRNRHFVRVCTEKMMDYQYRENGGRNIYSNYN